MSPGGFPSPLPGTAARSDPPRSGPPPSQRLVPQEVICAAWVALVAAQTHPVNSCNFDCDVKCFICDALTALHPYHHGSVGLRQRCPRCEWFDQQNALDDETTR